MDNKKLLKELKSLLECKLSLKIRKIFLYGSQINGNSQNYSDYDILIVLENDYNWKLEEAIYNTAYEIMLLYDVVLDIKIISIKDMETLKGQQPYIQNAIKSRVFA